MLHQGELAPAFSLPDADMELFDFASLRGRQNAVLFFYPRDGTPYCTLEAADFSDHENEFARLDCVILGATEVDVNFNVNVNTESNGYLLHNTGGHSDCAAGAKLSIIVAPAIRGRLPIVRDAVTTITTPGSTVGVIVTERGIAVNERHAELKEELIRRHAPVKDIRELHDEICGVTGIPRPLEFEDDIVGLVEYRDGSIIDVIRKVAA